MKLTQHELGELKRLTLNIQGLIDLDKHKIEEEILKLIDCVRTEENIYSS